MTECAVCRAPLGAPVYDSGDGLSLSSLCTVHDEPTVVHFCDACGHTQTRPLSRIEDYYDKDYRICLESEEEDQLYKVVDGRKIFRAEHQAATLLDKVEVTKGARVLDYGAAKAATLKRVVEARPDVAPHVFDVSDMYVPFWRKFLPEENCATYAPRPGWAERFDVVISFFALEHVAKPAAFARAVHGLLAEGGVFYFLVPNMYANIGDLVVCDHVNHFSQTSLHRLLAEAGFTAVEVDTESHDAAFVVVARKDAAAGRAAAAPPEAKREDVARLRARVKEMAAYWRALRERVRAFEAHEAGRDPAVYGAGFYGSFIACSLADRSKITCFVDQNPHLQRQRRFGKKIVPPHRLEPEVDTVYVGLNPRVAEEIVSRIPTWRGRDLQLFLP